MSEKFEKFVQEKDLKTQVKNLTKVSTNLAAFLQLHAPKNSFITEAKNIIAVNSLRH